MGGGDYDGDVAERTRSTRTETFTFRGYEGGDAEAARRPELRKCHKDLDIKKKTRECRDGQEHPNTTPIVMAMDVTRSRGDDAKVVYAKLPMFIGQMKMRNYVPHPTLCFASFGDATCDQAPIQVGQFESDNRLDAMLAKMWLEEGGGGTGQESSELVAYYFARHTELDSLKRGKKGYLFILTDEGFYPKVSREQVKKYIGDDLPEDLDSRQIFEELQRKYEVFVIIPKKKWEERKNDIDAEMKKRVEEAGGMYENVEIGMTLMWYNTNDLDLHVLDPCGHHIYFGTNCRSNGRPPAECGGYLDVDKNVHGETTKPVENIRWEKHAPKGHYKVFVQNYRFHERDYGATRFDVSIRIGNTVKHFQGETPANQYGPESNTLVYEFDYDPRDQSIRETAPAVDKYAAYNEHVIKAQWEGVLPADRVLDLEDPNGIIDLAMGVIAVTEGSVDLNGYIKDMEGRGQTELRRIQTRRSLTGLTAGAELVAVDIESDSNTGVKKKKGKTKRLNS